MVNADSTFLDWNSGWAIAICVVAIAVAIVTWILLLIRLLTETVPEGDDADFAERKVGTACMLTCRRTCGLPVMCLSAPAIASWGHCSHRTHMLRVSLMTSSSELTDAFPCPAPSRRSDAAPSASLAIRKRAR